MRVVCVYVVCVCGECVVCVYVCAVCVYIACMRMCVWEGRHTVAHYNREKILINVRKRNSMHERRNSVLRIRTTQMH